MFVITVESGGGSWLIKKRFSEMHSWHEDKLVPGPSSNLGLAVCSDPRKAPSQSNGPCHCVLGGNPHPLLFGFCLFFVFAIRPVFLTDPQPRLVPAHGKGQLPKFPGKHALSLKTSNDKFLEVLRPCCPPPLDSSHHSTHTPCAWGLGPDARARRWPTQTRRLDLCRYFRLVLSIPSFLEVSAHARMRVPLGAV